MIIFDIDLIDIILLSNCSLWLNIFTSNMNWFSLTTISIILFDFQNLFSLPTLYILFLLNQLLYSLVSLLNLNWSFWLFFTSEYHNGLLLFYFLFCILVWNLLFSFEDVVSIFFSDMVLFYAFLVDMVLVVIELRFNEFFI